jgi:hypothetical protein
MTGEETHKSLAAALLAFQAEAPTLHKNATGQIQSRTYSYVDLHTIVEEITPLLAKHGLTWTTRPTGTHDAPTLTYELLWEGEREDVTSDGAKVMEPYREAIAGVMPLYLPDAPTSQTLGSAITYARRYALTAVLNLVADEDDDGGKASNQPTRSYGKQGFQSGGGPSAKQREEIVRQIKAKKVTKDELARMLGYIGLPEEVKDGWIESLTPGREGTASSLIAWLREHPVPTGVSDVPSDDPPVHEKVEGEQGEIPWEGT